MMFIRFSLGKNVCDVLASLMAVALLAAMMREDLTAERIAVATYHEIVTYFGQDDPTTRTRMEALL
jgi:bacterioferritin